MRKTPVIVALFVVAAMPGFPQSAQKRPRPESAAAQPAAGRIDLNTASEALLETLPGVGPATAKRIVAGRPYASLADLGRTGIPQRTIDQIGPFVTVSRMRAGADAPQQPSSVSPSRAHTRDRSSETPQGTIDLNTASESQLETLPGVGPATAKKIIAGRPYSNVIDLARAGVPQRTISQISSLVTAGGTRTRESTERTDRPSNPADARPTESQSTVPNRPAAPPATASSTQVKPSRGMVWVNTDTKIYHHEGDRWYGKTQHGRYMTEEEAIRQGYRVAKK
jgi:DNA uptake protein ComE-like DNA-binding protein